MLNRSLARITLHSVHKWAGLVVALWLAVLAVTGLMLLNRQQWSWQWQSGLRLSESIAAHDDKHLWRHHQVDPVSGQTRVASGSAGAFLSEDGATTWQRLRFGNETWRNVAALEPQGRGASWTVWAGTNDGLWRLDRQTGRFLAEGLRGQHVNSVSVGDDQVLAVINASQVYVRRLNSGDSAWTTLDLAPLPADSGSAVVDLGRWLQDIHLGRGLFGGRFDAVLWNVVAVGLLILCLSGLGYWVTLRWHNALRRRSKE